MSRHEILQAALALPPEERVALSVELLESLDPTDDGVDEAWNVEVARRIAEIERGEAELVDADEVFREFGLRFSP